MKKIPVLLLCVAALMFFVFSDALAADNYFVVKAGMYSPQSGDLDEFDKGFNGEIAYGRYFNKNIAAEIGLGYFHTDASESGTEYGLHFDTEADVDVIPLTVALKAIAPIGRAELYALGGLGIYFTKGEIKENMSGAEPYSVDDTDAAFGGFLGAGLSFNITDQVFIGVEGKYHFVEADWEFEGESVTNKLDGWTVTGNLGFRF